MPNKHARLQPIAGDLDTALAALAGRPLAVFLDYDGTLCPIVERPELARIGPSMREALAALARRHTTAIVSGRALDDVRARIGLPELYYAGNHGFEIEGPAGSGIRRHLGEEFRDDIESAHAEIAAALADLPGVLIEHKGLTLSVHFRRAPERHAEVAAAVHAALGRHPRLREHGGKHIVEIRPDLDWHKGRAVNWLHQQLAPEAFPIYIGDDVTDEDAFRALADYGLGVLVSASERPTAAAERVRDCTAVRTLLEKLAAA